MSALKKQKASLCDPKQFLLELERVVAGNFDR